MTLGDDRGKIDPHCPKGVLQIKNYSVSPKGKLWGNEGVNSP